MRSEPEDAAVAEVFGTRAVLVGDGPELDWLHAAPSQAVRDHAFLRLWCAKEAVLKATGHGLLTAPDQVEVSPPFTPPRLVQWHADGEGPATVQLLDLALPEPACAAVAVLSEQPPVLVLRRGNEVLDLP